MLGYVLDGPASDAIRLVGDNIATRAVELAMTESATLAPSRLRPTADHIRETQHARQQAHPFLLQHLFLDCVNHGAPDLSLYDPIDSADARETPDA
jgi:hypothetical protein